MQMREMPGNRVMHIEYLAYGEPDKCPGGICQVLAGQPGRMNQGDGAVVHLWGT